MAYRFHGRANVNPNSPRAFGRCDRCGFIYNHNKLRFQFDFRGPQLQNLRFLVCDRCYDTPQAQLKPIILTQDPTPILNARPEDYNYANTNDIAGTEPTTTFQQTGIPVDNSIGITTEDGKNITEQPVGPPLGLDPNAIMPQIGSVLFDQLLPVLSISSIGTDIVTVTCSKPHGLSDNSQVAVTGVTNARVNGFYSVKVVSATVFSYEILPYISAGQYNTDTTRVATCSIGLPPNYLMVPIIGIATGVAGTPYQWVNNQGQPVYWENNSGTPILWSFSS
jgi:hypothetical protein